MRDLIVPLLENLGRREIYFLADIEDIPEAEFLPLAYRLAAEAAPEFNKPVDDATVKRLEVDLKRTWQVKPTYGPQRATYF